MVGSTAASTAFLTSPQRDTPVTFALDAQRGSTPVAGTFTLALDSAGVDLRARWTLEGQSAAGVGLRKRDRWGFGVGAGCGVAVLTLGADGWWDGTWVQEGGGYDILRLRRTP